MTDLVNINDRARSVTADDYEVAQGPGVLHVLVGPSSLNLGNAFVQQTGLPPQSAWPYARDSLLSATPYMSNMWAVAMQKAITKQVALGWQVEDSKDIATRTRRAQILIDGFDGNFDLGLQRHLWDFLTCDNGAWVEIARKTSGGASRVEGIYHLDSLRVVRTLDLNRPAWYLNRKGEYKELRYDFVQNFVDMPSPRLEMAGVGMSAASRAWDTIVKDVAIETYFREKVTGANQRAIFLITGISNKQLREALIAADSDAVSKGYIQYRGATLIPGFDSEVPPNFVQIDLSSIPDNFDIGQERERIDRIFSYAIGLALMDLQPLTGQGLGNGQQAKIIEEASEGMGLAAWRKQWVSFTKRVNPSTTTYTWSENDLTDRTKVADLQAKEIKNVVDMQAAGLIDTRQGQQLLLDAKILPPELAPPDLTPGGTLTDEEQPGDATTAPELAIQAGVDQAATANVPATKAKGHTGVMIALYPDPRAARAIGGLPGVTEQPKDLHVTLAFLGDSTEVPLSSSKDRIIAGVKQWALEHGTPLKGVINGVGRFFNVENDNTNAVYVSPDVPGLPELRQSLVQAIQSTGIEYAQNHGFTPHMTVAYVPVDAPTPDIRPDVPVIFTTATLAWGDEHIPFPLGVGAATKASAVIANDPPELTPQELAAARRLLERVIR